MRRSIVPGAAALTQRAYPVFSATVTLSRKNQSGWIAGFLLLGLCGPACVDAAEDLGRGWAPPTPEDAALTAKYADRRVEVHLNHLGARRVHLEQKAGSTVPNSFLSRPLGKGVLTASPGTSRAVRAPRYDDFLPDTVDNSQLPSFPPIINQGKLNSCTAVSSTYYQLTHMVGLVRGWDQKSGNNPKRFSPAWTYNLTNNGDNTGVYLLRSYLMLLGHGAPTLRSFPYAEDPSVPTNYRRWPESEAVWREALQYRLKSFGVLQNDEPDEFIRYVRELLVNGHVLTCATNIDGWNRRVIARDPSDPASSRHVGEYICTEVSTKGGNHAMTIVGYDEDVWVDLNGNGKVEEQETGALKLANSWGRGDWNGGFRWLHYSALRKIHADGAGARSSALYNNEAYWMVPRAFYEPTTTVVTSFAPALRNKIRFKVGLAWGDSRAVAHNFALDQNGGPYGFAGTRRANPIFGVIDLTEIARRLQDGVPAVPFVEVAANEGGDSALTAARFIHADGVSELSAAGDAQPGVVCYRASNTLTLPAGLPPLELEVPDTVVFTPGEPASFIVGVRAPRREPGSVKLQVVSSRGDVVQQDQLRVEALADGRYRVSIAKPVMSRGTCLLTIGATDRWSEAESVVRVNFVDSGNRPPQIELGAPAYEGSQISLPIKLADDHTAGRRIMLSFDAPEIDRVGSFKFEGVGANRTLRLQISGDRPLALNVSAYDGELTQMRRISLKAIPQ